jgi:hypothetical protein
MAIAELVLGVDGRLGGYGDLFGVSGGRETVLKGILVFAKVLCGGMVGRHNEAQRAWEYVEGGEVKAFLNNANGQ